VIDKLLPGIDHLQNVHPLLVHYPLAFLAGSAVFYGIAWLGRNERLGVAAFWMLMAGTATAGVALGTGLYAQEGVMVARSVRQHLLVQHEQLMIITAVLAAVLSGWAIAARPFPRRLRPLFLLLFAILLATMIKGADDGGRMVYDYNAGGSACGQPIEFSDK
jgi:uncharacterized membrane protein